MQLFGRVVLALMLIAAGLFGALNGRSVELDFLMASASMPLGVALMLFLVLGTLIGAAAVYVTVVPKLRRQLTELRKRTPTN